MSWSAIAQGLDSGIGINREYAIKAAFLYNFSRYIEWPADVFPADGKPFVIGVFHTNPFGKSLEQIALRKKVAGQPIEFRRILSPIDALECQILFVPKSVPAAEQAKVLKVTMGHPVLVVGEADDFVRRGGNVQFYVDDNRVRFAFGEGASKRDDLKISSKLLSLATIVPSQ